MRASGVMIGTPPSIRGTWSGRKLRSRQTDAGSNHPTIADWVTVALARWRPLGFHAERTPFRNALAISSLSSGFREMMSSVAAAEKLDVEGARRRCAIRVPVALLGCENRILEQCWRSSLLAELWWDGGKTSGDVIARP